MRKSIFILALLAIAAFAVTAFAEQPATPADGLKMAATKKVVTFNHSSHKDLKCADCHHPVDGKESFKKCSASGCHDNLDQKDKSVNSYYQAIHKAKDPKHNSCISCHKEKVGDDKDLKKKMLACKGSNCHVE
ncbi:cytochrome c3 family protein [Desulfovibrio litoralis]|uniref:Class III cytochrome C family protein n=1 Tax=Desulfovibrio litoralis DSM 11393 TaxID=1121455 RepID=A0A1M7SZ19_9BACT|nr:cytochrome c3 family protein [Desulfovibrio litoralis]SHN63732.1 Class III cytochrome C family protein [Desulfovibrio litoralis DSM 11393]